MNQVGRWLRKVRLFFTPVMLLAAIVVLAVIVNERPKKMLPSWVFIPVAYAILWVIWAAFIRPSWWAMRFWWNRSQVEKEVARMEEWRSRGLCTGCGYNLTGNESGVCPECGRRISSISP